MILAYGFCLSIVLMIFVWLIYCRFQNAAIIDVFWGINISVQGFFYLSYQSHLGLKLLMMGLLFIWGGRLSLFLLVTRIWQGHHDRRYQALSKDWHNEKVGYLGQYLLQGVLAWFIAMPFYFFASQSKLTNQIIISSVIICIGIIGESVADLQLLRHQQTHLNTICLKGLWRLSRHPNYFFECVVWFGFSLMAFKVGIESFSMLSIIMLFSIMWFITIPITERESLKKRGVAYQQYIKNTSCLLPWPKL